MSKKNFFVSEKAFVSTDENKQSMFEKLGLEVVPVQNIDVKDICLDPSDPHSFEMQGRTVQALNADAVKEYKACMAEGDQFPPIFLYCNEAERNKGKYYLGCGFTRFHAFCELGGTEIKHAYFIPLKTGQKDRFRIACFKDNCTHGNSQKPEDLLQVIAETSIREAWEEQLHSEVPVKVLADYAKLYGVNYKNLKKYVEVEYVRQRFFPDKTEKERKQNVTLLMGEWIYKNKRKHGILDAAGMWYQITKTKSRPVETVHSKLKNAGDANGNLDCSIQILKTYLNQPGASRVLPSAAASAVRALRQFDTCVANMISEKTTPLSEMSAVRDELSETLMKCCTRLDECILDCSGIESEAVR